MTSLWENVCQLLSTSLQSSAEILRQYEQFSQLHERLSRWLANIESSVSRDLEESFLSIPDDQRDTVFQVCLSFLFVENIAIVCQLRSCDIQGG